MSVIGTAKHQITGLLTNVVDRLADAVPHGTGRQTVTVACSVVEAEDFWRDPHRVSMILGDVGDVEFTAPDRYTWTLRAGDHEMTWDSTLYTDPGRLCFIDDESGNQIIVEYRAAPHHLGTEMTLRSSLTVPGMLSGTAAFELLYRARALLQTGEVPTIARHPSGRR